MMNALTCEAVARAALGEPARRAGAEIYWKCPRHDDEHPSLQINPKKNVWLCAPCGASGTAWALAAFIAGVDPGDKKSVSDWLRERGLLPEHKRKAKTAGNQVVAEYIYHDAGGQPVAKKLRYEPKSFSWQGLESGEWRDGLGGMKLPLYRQNEIAGEPFVIIVEGEKDCDVGAAAGLPTCTSGGVNSWRDDHADALREKAVCVVADADKEGRKHAQKVAASLHKHDIPVSIIEFSSAKDLAEFLEKGGSADDVWRLVDAAPECRPASGAEILNVTAQFIKQLVSLSNSQIVVGALWVAHTHAVEAATFTPYLHITSGVKQEGKSRLCKILGLLAANVKKSDNVSPAALVYMVDQGGVTLILDELDAKLRGDKEAAEILRGIINSGFERGGTYTRLEGEGSKRQVREWHTFSPKILSGIGKLWDTVEDRSITIKMRRAKKGAVPRWRERGKAWLAIQAQANKLKAELAAWAESNLEALADAEPELPVALSDRQMDICEPLLAIADLAGGGWPEAARLALTELCAGAQSDDGSIGVMALADIRRPFFPEGGGADQLKPLDRIASSDLVKVLAEMEDRPWIEWGRAQKPISPAQLARLLSRFDIAPRNIRFPDGRVLRGYERSQFEEAWALYLAADCPVPPPLQSATVLQPVWILSEMAIFRVLQRNLVALRKMRFRPIKTRLVAL